MVAQLPRLKKLKAYYYNQLTGNLENLKVIGSKLEKISLTKCPKVEGSIMSPSKFPRLAKFRLSRTKSTGDIRNIVRLIS